MPALGNTFREAREKKGATASEAAAATRIKVQHIEAIEQDDFGKIAAPAYAKGFIKLYAEYLGLDPRPLIQEYMEQYAPKERPPLVVEEESTTDSEDQRDRPSTPGPWIDLARKQLSNVLPALRRRWTWVAAGLLLVLILLSLKRCVGREAEKPAEPPSPAPLRTPPAGSLLGEPPDPYIHPGHR
jgi:transcriptional regulator with XRE-family HTH domain